MPVHQGPHLPKLNRNFNLSRTRASGFFEKQPDGAARSAAGLTAQSRTFDSEVLQKSSCSAETVHHSDRPAFPKGVPQGATSSRCSGVRIL